ncbi:GxxExxY protein [Schlesneria paludicola]|uniref:GxxExxY protein n=1 Tax=Schlesneria paludicola TaxID=360056 RepID=UPI000299DDEC|nr:GxxExxY protein [Schlesneria paludicola]
MQSYELTGLIISAAIEVHRVLGPGCLEHAYQKCLEHELMLREIPFTAQRKLPLVYKGIRVQAGYRIDVLVQQQVIVEIKAVDQLAPVHTAQLLTYLRLTECPLGLLMNFNVPVLKDGIRRVVNDNKN